MTTKLDAIPLHTIDGRSASIGDHAGKVRLVVNVASRCGLTPQYEALEALYRRYRDRGFEVLAFPANEFGAQEPGTNAEIKEFCSSVYDVTFPLFARIVVKGPGQHPLYAALVEAQPRAIEPPGSSFRASLAKHGIDTGSPDDISWNFEKFVISRRGDAVARFSPQIKPDSDLLISVVERELGASD